MGALSSVAPTSFLSHVVLVNFFFTIATGLVIRDKHLCLNNMFKIDNKNVHTFVKMLCDYVNCKKKHYTNKIRLHWIQFNWIERKGAEQNWTAHDMKSDYLDLVNSKDISVAV